MTARDHSTRENETKTWNDIFSYRVSFSRKSMSKILGARASDRYEVFLLKWMFSKNILYFLLRYGFVYFIHYLLLSRHLNSIKINITIRGLQSSMQVEITCNRQTSLSVDEFLEPIFSKRETREHCYRIFFT